MLSKKTQKLTKESSVIRALFVEGARLKKLHGEENVFDFSLGNPSVPTPKQVNDSIIDLLKDEESLNELHGYMNNSGFIDVRTNISNNINSKYNTNFSYENIIMTVGAAGGLNIVFNTILNPDDEVILFAPFFSEYKNYLLTYDAKTIISNTNTDDFQIDLIELEKNINENTKALIINTPNNPTGVIYTEDTIKKLASLLKRKEKDYGHPIFLISDEPYRELIHNDINIPYVTKYYDNTFIIYSYSKSLSLPGERIGYVVAPSSLNSFEDIIAGLNVSNRVLGFVNAPSLFQKVIGKCNNINIDITPYSDNLNLLYNELINIGYECVKPDGAFYLFPKSPISDDVKFCELAKEKNLLIVPGSGFFRSGHFRIAYCTPIDVIKRAIPVFKELFEECKK